MKELFLGFLKKLAKAIAVLGVLIGVYLFFLYRDIKKIEDFCNELESTHAVFTMTIRL